MEMFETGRARFPLSSPESLAYAERRGDLRGKLSTRCTNSQDVHKETWDRRGPDERAHTMAPFRLRIVPLAPDLIGGTVAECQRMSSRNRMLDKGRVHPLASRAI